MTSEDELPHKRQKKNGRPLRIRLAVIPPYVLQAIAWPFARLLFTFFARMRVEGHEELQKLPRKVIFAANHTSHLDPILVRAAVPYLTHIEPMFYVARQYKDYGWRGWRQFLFSDMFFRIWGAYPAYKGTGSYEKSLEKLVELASHGLPICMFPCGIQKSPQEEVSAHGGIVHLAWATGAVVVPVAISGTHTSTVKTFLGRKTNFTVSFGQPIDIHTHIVPSSSPTLFDYKRTAKLIADEIHTLWRATDHAWFGTTTHSAQKKKRGFRTVRNLYRVCADLLLLVLPFNLGSDDIAFIVHPRDRRDVYGKYPFLKLLGDTGTDWITKHLWPVRVAPILGVQKSDKSRVRGWIYACPMTAEQMLHDRKGAVRAIQRAARLAQRRGVHTVGLGALSASLSRGGLDVAEALPLRVTTGRLFTIYNVSDLVLHGLLKLDIPHRDAHVAVVGAAGSIGAGVAQQLSRFGVRRFTLIDLSDKHEDVTHVANQMRKHNPDVRITTATSLSVLKDVHAIVTATNRPDALIKSEHVSPGTLIVDDAQPSDLAPELFDRTDLLVLEGGVVHSPHVRVPYKLGLREEGDIFSCMAELIVLAHTPSLTGSTLGRSLTLDIEAINDLVDTAHTIGLSRAKLQNMRHLYTDDEIAYIRTCRVRSKE